MNTLSKIALVLVTALLLPLLLISNAGIVSPRGTVVLPSVVLPPVPKWPRTFQLTWDYPFEVVMDIEFEIWRNTNSIPPQAHWCGTGHTPQMCVDPWKLSSDWKPYTNVARPPITVTANLQHALFILRAKDKRSGKVSDWAGD